MVFTGEGQSVSSGSRLAGRARRACPKAVAGGITRSSFFRAFPEARRSRLDAMAGPRPAADEGPGLSESMGLLREIGSHAQNPAQRFPCRPSPMLAVPVARRPVAGRRRPGGLCRALARRQCHGRKADGHRIRRRTSSCSVPTSGARFPTASSATARARLPAMGPGMITDEQIDQVWVYIRSRAQN